MLIYKRIKSIPIDLFLFILLIHHVRVEAKVTGMKTICTETPSDGLCKTVDGDLSENLYCLSGDKKIYKSDTSSCTAINTSAAVVSIFEKKTTGYELGTTATSEGIIYSCADNGSCEQLVDTYYYSTNLYKCDATGKCTKQTTPSGNYLTGVGTVSAGGIVTYSAVTCNNGSCSNITASKNYIDTKINGNVIVCDAQSKCKSVPGSNVPGVAYIDGSDSTNTKKIIQCTGSACSSTDLSSHTNILSGLYYIDGSSDRKKLIKCDSSSGCVVDSNNLTTEIKSNSDSDTNWLMCTSAGCISTKKITECNSSTADTNELCKDNAATPVKVASGKVCIKSDDGKIYLSSSSTDADGNTSNSCTAENSTVLIKEDGTKGSFSDNKGYIFVCDGSSACTQYVSSYYKDTSNSYIYSCDNGGLCTRNTSAVKGVHLSGVATPGTNGYTYTSLLECEDTTISKCKSVSPAASKVYLDADNSKNVIICGASSCYSTPGVTTPGFVYQNAGSGKKLIQCSSTKCEDVDPKLSTAGFAYIDAGASSISVLKCDSTTSCSSAGTLAAGNTYIDGTNTDEKNVIYCSSTTACSSLEGSTVADHAYKNAINAGKVITCNSTSCSSGNGDKNSGHAYINAITFNKPLTCASTGCTDGTVATAKDTYIDAQNNDHVVVCSAASCISMEANVDQDTAYMTESTSLKTVIQCSKSTSKRATTTASVSCSVLPAVTTGTSYYIDATDSSKIVTCTGGGSCSSAEPASVAVGTAYLNPLVPSRVIQCTTTTVDTKEVTNCASRDSATTELPIVHYINAVTTKQLITCKYTSTATCEDVTSPKVSTSGYAYRDYLNIGNIIKCTSDACSSVAAVDQNAVKDTTVPVKSVGYIDAVDTNEKTAITCTDWTASGATTKNITCSTVEVTEADGRAFLDGASSFTSTEGFAKIISYDSSTKKLSQVTTAKLSTDGFAYIDGTDESKKRIIKCTSSTTCAAYNNDSAEAVASPATPAVNAFYIDGVTDTNYIICKPSEGCSSHPGTETGSTLPKYYPDSINGNYVIECAANQGACQHITAILNTVGYYVDGYTDGILSCDGTKCAPLPTVNTEELTGYMHFEKKSVIHCSVEVTTTPKRRAKATPTTTTKAVTTSTSTVCVALPTNTGTTDAYYFINANDSSNIITCPTSSAECTPAAAPTTSLNKAYAYNNPSDSKIIQCTTEESKTVCKGKEGASEANPKIHYIEAVSPFTNIITCLYDKTTKAITCSKLAAVTDDGFGYIDYMNKGHIIKCQSSSCTSDESPAKAKTDALPAQNANYIDGYDTTETTVITCVNKGNSTTSDINCTSKTITSLPDGHAFLDGASSANNEFKNLLTYDATNKKMVYTAPTKFSTDSFFYIDGSDNNLETIINCVTGPVCKAEMNKADEEVNAFYINGLNVTSIITCTNEDGCISDTGSKVSGQAYRNSVDLKKIITCGDSACAASVGVDSTGKADSYINADDPSQIIHCPDSTKDCLLMDSNASANRSSYFPRYKEESASLLNCTRYSSTNTTCELTTTTATHKFNVFLNTLYNNEELTTAKPLITCDNDNKCKPSDPTFANESKSSLYYPNSDPVNTKEDLIVCSKDSDDNVKCSISKGKEKDVYLNANFDSTNNKKQIIICGVGESCLEQSNNSTSTTDLRYFVNAGVTFKNALNDTLIECNKDTCAILTTVEDDDIYIDEFDNSHIIHCTESKGCVSMASQATDKKNEIFLNSSNLHKESGTEPEKNEPLKNDIIKCVNTNSTITCSAQDGQPDEVYVNSHNTTEIIYCTANDGCKSKASEALPTQPEFYVNADPTDEEKLDGDLIKCRNNGSKITCEVTKGNDGDVYLNANVDNDAAKNPLIICSKEVGCITDASKAAAESLPAYYVNSGSVASVKLNDTLIECTYDKAAECEIRQALANDVYVNYANNTETHPLIKCNNNGCKVAISSATEKSNEYYLNAGDTDEKALDYDIIECSDDGETIECKELEKTGEGVYLNSNYSEKGDSNQLILCSSDNGCEGIKTSEKKSEYYVNAEASDLTNAIIFCSNKKCEKQTPINIPTYYVGAAQDGEVSGLIECNKLEVDITSTATATTTATATATATTTVAASRRRKRATQEICKLKSAFTSNGYFLNAGYNKAINQTIICDSSDGCETVKVDLGYYVNAGDDTKPIIKCDKDGSECASEESNNCPVVSDAVAGDYCYEEGLLKFFPEGNSTAIAASKSDDIYTFATIPSGGFPGIKSETGALFKISRYFINRFYQSGIVMIDKNGKLVDNLSSSDQSDINLYDCNDSTKVCSVRPGCTSDTYMYDSENKKAVYCNAGKLEYAEFTGYVVDSNRVVGSNHPYIIYCENNGNKCSSLRPKVNSYYENSGYDSATNSLIECSNNNCVTKTADVGYYIGHEGAGIIQCTSTTSCTFTKTKSNVKYVNAGSSKSSKAIISCNKNGCSAVKANIGYYLTYTSTLLIQCTSPMSCVEFTPTVNYYDNADSTESSNTIINCVQNSQVVTCAPEATNNGFYMSSSPNVLIRCKSGNKCKAVKVKNGIFRGAIKALTGGGSKRTSEEDVELEEDGKSVAMPRDSDDSYDIIRCVQEKCTALSPSEVSAIPICEFNNNKCYITLDYAMTKSATTSISAGNICTNSDRSVFYFATDTIVVKPNVISGVTATYVYTTTNSNCLEVNDSYTDMYFTVGSNIYLLDQGSVLQFYEQGYYFINTAKNAIVNGNDIDAYNDENVKLYKCNGNSCSIMDKPDSLTYYADVNKRIIRYNVNSDSYSFAYEKDITCIFANNKCTPNADLKNQEFCITYKGELALATADIKNRETGECYKASTISSNIYGYSQYLYNMNMYSAQMVDETGYYIVSLSTNTTVVSKNYKTKNNNLVVYGCQLSSCKVIEPDENVYYYDFHAKTILRYKDGVWKTPDTSGYAYISIDPANTYIYRFTKNAEEVKINGMANYGYYYTVDGEMYNCDRDEDGDCTPIDNTGYYFTNAGEVYYCVHDSEEIEPTECTKQACVSGQYYSIDGAYYRCESSSTLIPVMSRYCSYNENVVINFPLALTEEFPDKIKQAVEGIEKNNNSTAIVSRRGKNYLESVSGIFTNCTYNVEETKSTFDLVCVNNYVTVDEETDDVKICSMEQLGYVECIEDEENPEKCNVSGVISRISLSIFSIIIITIMSILLL